MPSYNLMLGVAAGVLFLGGTVSLYRSGVKPLAALLIVIGGLLAGFIGARGLHLIVHWSRVSELPTGWALDGALILAPVAVFLLAKSLQVPALRSLDRLAPWAGLSIALIRFGCYSRGCCYGAATTLPWGVEAPNSDVARISQLSAGQIGIFSETLPVHPTQLYELIAALAGAALAWVVIRRGVRPGVAALSFGLWIGLFRLFNARLRTLDLVADVNPQWFTLVVVLGCLLGLMGIWLQVFLREHLTPSPVHFVHRPSPAKQERVL